MHHFWHGLPQPIVGLSPMDGVTDSVFRRLVAAYGKPDVIFTEFTNVNDICFGRALALDSLCYSEAERPIVAQIYGKDPHLFYRAAHVVCELGFDGLDINMGCPSKNVASSGSGAGLIRTPELALNIMDAAYRGIRDWAAGQGLAAVGFKDSQISAIEAMTQTDNRSPRNGARRTLPLSVKTRLGYDRNVIDEWSDCLVQGRPEVISIHGRTLSQMYRGMSDWDAIACAASRIRRQGILTLGNGDIQSLAHAGQRVRDSAVDGVLIGRATLGHPWMFQDLPRVRDNLLADRPDVYAERDISLQERFDTMIAHAELFETIKGAARFPRMRKHLGWYCHGFPHAASLRAQMVRTTCTRDVMTIVEEYAAAQEYPARQSRPVATEAVTYGHR